MTLYKLKPEEVPNLEKKLQEIVVPKQKEDEVLDTESFALIRATPDILENSRANLSSRLQSNDFRIRFSFHKKKGFTYSLLYALGVKTAHNITNELISYLQNAQDRLTRFLSMYSPSSLSDTKGQQHSTLEGMFIHQALSSLFTPVGFVANADVDSEYHTINYGHEVLDLPLDTGIAYLGEFTEQILNTRKIYEKLARTLVFLTELAGLDIDIYQKSQLRYKEISTQVSSVNSIIKNLRSLPQCELTAESVKKFVALHNAIGYLINDIPLKEIESYENIAEGLFHYYVARRYSVLRLLSLGGPIERFYQQLGLRRDLNGAQELFYHAPKLLEAGKQDSPL